MVSKIIKNIKKVGLIASSEDCFVFDIEDFLVFDNEDFFVFDYEDFFVFDYEDLLKVLVTETSPKLL